MIEQAPNTVQHVTAQAQPLCRERKDIVKDNGALPGQIPIAHVPLNPHARLRGAVRSVVGVVLITLLSAVVGPLAVASTPIPQPEFLPLAADISFFRNPLSPPKPRILIEKSVELRAGESRRVYGRVEITSSTTNTVLVEVFAQCLRPDGQQSGVHATAGTNHEGSDTPASPPESDGVAPVSDGGAPAALRLPAVPAAKRGDVPMPALGGGWRTPHHVHRSRQEKLRGDGQVRG